MRNVVPVLVALMVAVPGSAATVPATGPSPATNARSIGDFVVVREWETKTPAFGILMICPTHDHGTPQEAEAKLRRLREQLSPENVATSTVWVCRINAAEGLRRFTPIVERAIVNPFVELSSAKPVSGDVIWPGIDQPLLNQCRAYRHAIGKRRALACIDLGGEDSLFGKRSQSFEETEWQVLAVVGADYKGLVWRDPAGESTRPRLLKLEADIRAEAAGLGAATPVDWGRSSGGQPVATLLSGDRLYVVVLNPAYMRVVQRAQGRVIDFPLDHPVAEGDVELSLPGGVSLTNVATLSGKPVLLSPPAGAATRFRFQVRGGGEMFVCRLTGRPDASREATTRPGPSKPARDASDPTARPPFP